MITITNEESKMILEMLFENPETLDAAAQARMFRELPDVSEKQLTDIAGTDRNILLTLIAAIACVGLTVEESSRSTYLDQILRMAGVLSWDPDLLRELCAAGLPRFSGALDELTEATYDALDRLRNKEIRRTLKKMKKAGLVKSRKEIVNGKPEIFWSAV